MSLLNPKIADTSKEDQALALEDRVSKVDAMIEDMNARFPGKLPPAVADEWNATRSEVMRVVTRRAPPDAVTGAGEQGDSIGQPWKLGLQRTAGMVAKAPMTMAQIGGANVADIDPFMTQPGVWNPQPTPPTGELGKEFYEKLDPTRKAYFQAVDERVKSMIPARLPTGKYAGPPKNFKEYFTDPKRAWMTIGQNGPQLGAFFVAEMVNPALGTALMGAAEAQDAQESMDTWEKQTGTKIPTEYKVATLAAVGSLNAALEKAGLDQIIKVAKVPGLKGKILQGLVSVVSEGSQEGLQEVNQILAEKGYNPDSWDWRRIADSFYGGALLGFGGSIISGTTGTAKEYYEGSKKVINQEPPAGTAVPPGAAPPPGGAGPGPHAGPNAGPGGPEAGPYSWQRPNEQGAPPPPPREEAPSPGVQDATRGTPGVTPEEAQKMHTGGRFREIPTSDGNWTAYVNIGKDGNVDYFVHNPEIPNGPVDRIVQLTDGSKKLIQGAYKSNPAVITKLTGIPITTKGTLKLIEGPKEVPSASGLRGNEGRILHGIQKERIQPGEGIETGENQGGKNIQQPTPRQPGRKVERLKSFEAKEPWQMTREEFQKQVTFKPSGNDIYTVLPNKIRWLTPGTRSQKTALKVTHEALISQAIEAGETIPEKVLKDYPDLAKQVKGKAVKPAKPISPRMKNWKSIIVGKLSAEEARDLSDAELRRAFKGATAPIQLFRNAKDLIASGALTEKDIVRETGKEPTEPAPKPQPIPVKSPDASTIINLHNAHLRMTLNQLEANESKFKRDMVEYNEGSAPNDAKYKIVREGDKKYVVERTFGDKTEKIVGGRRGEFISQEDALVWTFQDYKLSNPGEPESKRENIFEKPMRESEERARALSDEVGEIFKRRDEALDEIEKLDFTILGGREGKGHFKEMVRRSTRPDEIADIVKQAKEASLKQAEIAEAEEKERQLNIEGRRRYLAESGIKEKFISASTMKERTDLLKTENAKINQLGTLPVLEGKVTRKKYSPESAAFLMTSEDELRPLLQGIHHNKNGNLEATNGRMLISIKDASDKSGETKDSDGNSIPGEFPSFDKVIPKKKDVRNLGSFSVEEGLRITRQAQKFRIKDYGFHAYPIVKIESGFYDPPVLGPVIEAIYGLGYDKVNVSWKGIKDPLLFETDDGRITAVVMPIILDEGEQNYDWKPSSPAKKKTSSATADVGGYAPSEEVEPAQQVIPGVEKSTINKQIYSDAFKEWFGDWENDPDNASKVVDEDGPLVVYHGTKSENDFYVFDTHKGREIGSHFGTTEQANIFAGRANKETGELFEHSRVLPVYLSIKNPLLLKDEGSFNPEFIIPQLIKLGVIPEKENALLWPFHSAWHLARGFLKSSGYDGITYLNRRETPDIFRDFTHEEIEDMSDEEFKENFPDADYSWIAFDPSQIKSAIGNRGAFSRTNPNISADVGGYAPEVGEYGKSEEPGNRFIPLPELVKMARELLGGKFPRIFQKLAGNWLGVFRGDLLNFGIELKADIFKGHQLTSKFSKTKLNEDEKQALISRTGLPAEKVVVSQAWNSKLRGWVTTVYQVDPALARRVLAHEIGHLVDFLPDRTLARGNILGRIASFKGYMENFLQFHPGQKFNPLTEADRDRIRKEARNLVRIDSTIRTETPVTPDQILQIWNTYEAREKDPDLYKYISGLTTEQKKSIVKEALRGKVADWMTFMRVTEEKTVKGKTYEDLIVKKYHEMIHEEARKRQLYEQEVITGELKKVTQLWKPFDPEANPKFTKYRHSSKELYADAFSMLLNDPVKLKKIAPTFHEAFFNWFGRKPQVRDLYNEIQAFLGRSEEEIFKGRQADIGAMFKAAGERRIAVEAEKEKRAEGGSILGDLFKKFVDRDQPLLKRVREVQRTRGLTPEENPRYSKEELDYVADAQYQYMRDVDEFVIKHAKEAGVTEEHLGTYLLLHRAGTERKYFANPLGYNETESKRQAGMLLKSLGVEGAARLKEAVARFHEIRKRHVIAMMKVSKMYSDDLMEHIEGNFGNYATFNVVKYLEDKHGVNTFTAAIKRQIGTFSDIENPLLSTVLKDIVMVRSMQRKMALDDLFNFMHVYFPQEIRDAEMKWDANLGGKTPAETQEGGWQTIMSMDHGKMKGYDLSEALAGVYNRAPRQASALIRLMGKAQTPWKNLVVSKNLAWMVWNLVRDFKKTYLANKEVKFFPLLKNYFKVVKDARLDVFANKSTSIVREMYENRALLQGRYFTASSDEPNAMMDRVMLRWGLRDTEYKNNVLKPFRLFLDELEKAGRFTERIGKIAGYRTLKEAGLNPREIAHRVRGRVGSPNFYSRGEWFTFYNNLFVFSNAGMQGLRSQLEATRQTPGTVAFRVFAMELAPKLMMRAAQSGALVAIALALADDDEDDPKVRFARRMQAMMEKIPERDKANYICIPFGETAAGKVVYMVIPHDFTGQALGGILWEATGGKDFRVEDLMDYIQGGLPYSGLNPHLQFIVDMGLYSSGRNPYDSWTGKEMVPEDKWNAGGKIRLKAFLEQEWNRLGGSYIHRFKYDDLEKVQSEYEKILDLPLAGQALKRFVRVSDRGLSDKFRTEMDKDEQEAARRRLEINDAIVKDLNETEEPGRGSAKELYNKLRADGVEVGEWHDFWTKYQTRMNYRENNAYSYSLQKARTKAQKQRILTEELGTEVSPGRVKAATTLAKLRVKKRTEGLTPAEEANLEKLEQLFKKGVE